MSETNVKHVSTIGVKSIPNREKLFKNADAWIEDKQKIDGAEGLWRVHNAIYDLTSFIDKHPGGKFWIDITKGTDITEAFESHHISTLPESLLKNYLVREAKQHRSSPFTFEENGFYRTVKKNVREALRSVPESARRTSKVYTDALFVGAFMCSIFASAYWSYALAVVSGILLASAGIAAHNYFHQRDNFRMYYSDICLIEIHGKLRGILNGILEWRIVHVLSHHLYTNSVADMQAYIGEPFVNFFPEQKSPWTKYGPWFYTPVLFLVIVHLLFVVRIYQWLFLGYTKSVTKADLLSITLPLTMYVFGGQPLIPTIGMWFFILAVLGIWYGSIALGTTHFHPELFMDGDASRPGHEKDWGLFELDTVADKHEVTGSHFLGLIAFGDHALHHLFPALDQGVLQYLYPVVEKTAREFNVEIEMRTLGDLFSGFFRQMARDRPTFRFSKR